MGVHGQLPGEGCYFSFGFSACVIFRGLAFIQYLVGPRGDSERSRVDDYWDIYALCIHALGMADVDTYRSPGCRGHLVGGTA